jgi:hypothetical protein
MPRWLPALSVRAECVCVCVRAGDGGGETWMHAHRSVLVKVDLLLFGFFSGIGQGLFRVRPRFVVDVEASTAPALSV